MILYLLRHGIAVPHEDPDCPRDEDRPLTPKGVRRTREVARGLRALALRPDAVISSPLVRALETARIAAKGLGIPPATIRTSRGLEPGAPPREFLDWLDGSLGKEVLLVGHNPNLNRVLGAALGFDGEPPFALKKAGAARVDLEPEGPLLRWLLEPAVLRRLG